MNAEQFKELVNSLDVGKNLPDSVYFHKDAGALLLYFQHLHVMVYHFRKCWK